MNLPGEAVAHLQHLAFGASPALIDAFPELRRIALDPLSQTVRRLADLSDQIT
jgi:hypothetical protein